MNILRNLLCLLVIAPLGLGLTQPVQATASLWQSVAAGIDYREFYLDDPAHLYVARMDRSNPDVVIESGIGQGKLIEGAETVRDLAARYDQAINYASETWGNRNQIAVAINGFFFDTETGTPWQGQIQSGWYTKRFDDRQSGSGIAWTLDRTIFIGDCVVHPQAKQSVTFLHSGSSLLIDDINVSRTDNQLVVYTSHYDRSTHTEDGGVEVLVELTSPFLILPAPAMLSGQVRAIRDGVGDSLIPFDHIVLSASGKQAANLRTAVQLGDKVEISQEIKQYETDCRTPRVGGWEKTYAAVGASFVFLRDGALQAFDDLGALLRSPRTVVAFDDRYIYFIVVDGRDRFLSQGMSMVEMAVFVKTQLGATWGVALDGGGSSTMVVNGQVVNRPNVELAGQVGTDLANQAPIVERVVGNSLFMVVVQPKEVSKVYNSGDQVVTVQDVAVRMGPGTNYAVGTTISTNVQGVILEHASQLNGVLAKGSYWWKVAFGDITGWVPEEALNLRIAP